MAQICICHNSSISDPGNLQPLTDEKHELLFKRVKKKRLLQHVGDSNRMAAICLQVPDIIQPEYGYHTNCSKRFTMSLKRLRVKESDDCDESSASGRSPRKKASILFPPECIFVAKKLNM